MCLSGSSVLFGFCHFCFGLFFRRHPHNRFHQFCRYLGKLKSNYQLTELVNTEGYQKWIQLASQFSIDSFRQWQLSSASSHYILQLWSRMVTAMPYVREEAGVGGHLLNEYVPRIMQAYINGKLQEIEAAVKCENGIVLVGIDGEVEHPLNDPEVLETHLAVRACVRACSTSAVLLQYYCRFTPDCCARAGGSG